MIPFVILAIEDENDRVFMTDLFIQYNRLMLSEIRKIVRDRSDPEDVLQSALVKLIDKIPLLREMEERARVNYLVTTARNTALSDLRRLKKEAGHSLDDEGWLAGACLEEDSTVEEAMRRGEIVDMLEESWPLLDERSRFLLESRYFLGMSFSEIAAELDIKDDSARMELSRARKKARAILAEHYARTGG